MMFDAGLMPEISDANPRSGKRSLN